MFDTVIGVDFSGAKLAGRNIWLARLEPAGQNKSARFHRLIDLVNLEKLCGTADRAPALAHLVEQIAQSRQALWALDFPFGLPIEVQADGASWDGQVDFVTTWEDDAYSLGVECVRRAKAVGVAMHIRRHTDVEARTPFDCYHYRIIYQTFHGMRDVLGPLVNHRRTAILPFHYRRLRNAERVLVEACPSSTLKRLGLPHQNYKQPAGGPLALKRLQTRRAILDGLANYVEIAPGQRRIIMRNGGGDALDAVIAAVGGAHAWADADHRAIARHPRYPREGRLYV
jgi:hypothetical protein